MTTGMSWQFIEPIFGVLKRQWGMDYTILKGRQRVETEYRIAAISYNLLRTIQIKGLKWLKKRLKKAIFNNNLSVMHIYASHRIISRKNNFQKIYTQLLHTGSESYKMGVAA